MKQELFIPIRGYEGLYAVSNFGRVKSCKKTSKGFNGSIRVLSEKILKPGKHRQGYLLVNLWKNEKPKLLSVHRLVAMAFIPNPKNLPQVLHKDDNTENNHVDNLFWGTHAENMRDCSQKNRQRHRKRPVVAILPDMSREYEFESVCEASRQTGFARSSISYCCRGKLETVGGFIWQYA